MTAIDRFQKAIEAFDKANARDPEKEVSSGAGRPKELLYAERMSEWLDKLEPDASEALRLAARCQHLERWVIPRDEYPMDRPGYLKWRNALKKYHAGRAREILNDVGYDEETIGRVEDLVMKKGLKTDSEAQTLEDVICLVFLKYYFDDFAGKHEEEKIISILQKTWRKMSPRGQEAALKLEMPDSAKRLVEKALDTPE